MPSHTIENFLLRSKLAKDSIETILIFSIIDHGFVVFNIGWDCYTGPKATIDSDVISLFEVVIFEGLAYWALLIIGCTFHKCLGQVNCNLMNIGIMIIGVCSWRRWFWGGCEGGEEVAIWRGEAGCHHLLIMKSLIYNGIWISESEEVTIVIFILSLHQNHSSLHILSLDLHWALLHQFKYLLIQVHIADILLTVVLHH